MKNPTRTGTVYTSRNLTRHYASGVAGAVLLVVGVAFVAVLLAPSILDVLR